MRDRLPAFIRSGPGQWTNFLNEAGNPALGVDLVPEFIEHARVAYPGIPFRTGSLDALDVSTGTATMCRRSRAPSGPDPFLESWPPLRSIKDSGVRWRCRLRGETRASASSGGV